MALDPDWRRIVRKAWSFKLNVVAGAFIAAETLLPFFSDAVPKGWFAAIAFVVIIGANVMRVVCQKGYHD